MLSKTDSTLNGHRKADERKKKSKRERVKELSVENYNCYNQLLS